MCLGILEKEYDGAVEYVGHGSPASEHELQRDGSYVELFLVVGGEDGVFWEDVVEVVWVLGTSALF